MVCDDDMTSACKDTENQKQGGEVKPLLENVDGCHVFGRYRRPYGINF
jgi:hypothetical protein